MKVLFVSNILLQGHLSETHYPTVARQLGEFLYICKEHVENNLFVKYYVRMTNFNKVTELLKFKSHCFQWEAQIERVHSVAKSPSVGLSIPPPKETMQIRCRFKL